MKKIVVDGKCILDGTVSVQGSKNAVLPILASTLLTKGVTVLSHCPKISDVDCMIDMLRECGVQIERIQDRLRIEVSDKPIRKISDEQFTKMRSSAYFLGVSCGRKECIEIPGPGGCVIGRRPIDAHIEVLERAGVKFGGDHRRVYADPSQIKASEVVMPIVSVGATQNIVMALVKQEGLSVIRNAACEPEVISLCDYLNRCGARIYGAGSKTIWIEGTKRLEGCHYRIPPDRIVTGTYMIAVAATRGRVCLQNVDTTYLGIVIELLESMGASFWQNDNMLYMDAENMNCKPSMICTDVYPGFPTDLQSAMIALECVIYGDSTLEENIFEDRFRVVSELQRMGAQITIDGNKVHIKGKEQLTGAKVRGKELRGTAALIIAALTADSVTEIEGYEFLHRGYESIIEDLNQLGAKICLEESNESGYPQL